MKILIFGTGDYYQRYKKWLESENVVALIDNDINKQGKIIDDVIVISPKSIHSYEYDYIVILSFQYRTMKEQLLLLGIKEELILHFYSLRKIIDWKLNRRELVYTSYAQNKGMREAKNILLLSPELTIGGPGLALLGMAKILKKNGYNVTICSMIDGPLNLLLKEEEIPLIIDNNMQLSVMTEETWTHSYDLIVCNTLNFHVFLSDRNNMVPCIWWLHDASFFYEGVDLEIIKKIDSFNLYTYSVGPIPRRAIHEWIPELKVKNLLYSVDDEAQRVDFQKKSREKTIFLLIGFLEEIKAQDLLIDVIDDIYDSLKGKTEFYIIGYNETMYGYKLMERCKNYTEVHFTGILSRDEIHFHLSNASALVCPSRQDSMPTVVTEALMHATPCIISDVIGTSEFLSDKSDCLKFESGNKEQLAEQLMWCINNPEELVQIGRFGRRRYEEVFAPNVFEKEVLGVVNEIIGQS